MQAGRRPRSRRRFDYERRLLPNPHLAALEPEGVVHGGDTVDVTHWSLGYPAWNLLYYSLYCSLAPETEDAVVVETGTHRGVSTIVMAQALKDLGVDAVVETVELEPELVAAARANVESAGLGDRVRFHEGDAVEFLSELAGRVDGMDFVLLDDMHAYPHVIREVEIVCPKVGARGGKVYFDNTAWGGVAKTLRELQSRYGGNVVRFDNCSWEPPGNAIWQPSPPDGPSPPREPGGGTGATLSQWQ